MMWALTYHISIMTESVLYRPVYSRAPAAAAAMHFIAYAHAAAGLCRYKPTAVLIT